MLQSNSGTSYLIDAISREKHNKPNVNGSYTSLSENKGSENWNERDETLRLLWKTQIGENHKQRSYKSTISNNGTRRRDVERKVWLQ